jgi:hypothetical protein
MIDNIDSDLIGQLNRLLEQLHQKGGNLFGSQITLIKVEKGAQYVSHIGSQVFGIDKPDVPTKDRSTSAELPEPLATPEAMALWRKAQQAGYVNEHFQPLLSRTQAAMLAYEMTKLLGIRHKWRIFEAFWNRKNMRGDYNDALNQRQTLAFQDSIKALFY